MKMKNIAMNECLSVTAYCLQRRPANGAFSATTAHCRVIVWMEMPSARW